MKNKPTQIPPTAEEMVLWKKGEFPAGERRVQIAQWIDDHPFIQDALEGMELDPQLSGFVAQPATPHASHKSHFKGWIIGLAVGIGCALLAVSIWNPNQTDDKSPLSIIPKTTSPTNQNTKESTASNELKTAEKVQNKHSAALPKKESTPVIDHASESPFQPISYRNGQLNGGPPAGRTLRKLNVCIDIHGYEVYPYYERSKVQNVQLPGLPADNGESQVSKSQVGYLTFLEESIVAFQDNEIEIALDHVNLILNQFPDDINALYLKAKCIFKTSPTKALPFFEKTLSLNQQRLSEQEIKEYIRMSQ